MRGIVIPADDLLPIKAVDLADDDLPAMQRIVGGSIEGVMWVDAPHGVDVYANEEGKILGLPGNARATHMLRVSLFVGDWVAGDVLVIGVDHTEGEACSLPDAVTVASIVQACGGTLRTRGSGALYEVLPTADADA